MRHIQKHLCSNWILSVSLLFLSCSSLSPETDVLAHTHGNFSISITCHANRGSDSYGQYLRVSRGSRNVYSSFTRDFDTFNDCATSVSKIEVLEESMVLLTFYDKVQIWDVGPMRQFSQ